MSYANISKVITSIVFFVSPAKVILTGETLGRFSNKTCPSYKIVIESGRNNSGSVMVKLA